ncbi:MAG: Two component transcriptional regulator, winged helix family [Verrucomicrobiales bacterium]|nr:Two component transcriptional regulator, winged helix family [Verrucomicrobiales bacterium]
MHFNNLSSENSGRPFNARSGIRRKILLVNGDRKQCALHAAMLALSGFTTRCVHTGAEALEALDFDRFDVVLTEAVIPGTGVRDLVHAIRDKGDNTAVVVLSGKNLEKSNPALSPEELVDEIPRTASSRELISAVCRRSDAAPSWHSMADLHGDYDLLRQS